MTPIWGEGSIGKTAGEGRDMLEILVFKLAQVVVGRLGGIAIDRVLARLLDRITGAKRPASVEEVKAAVREALAQEGAQPAALDRALGDGLADLRDELAGIGKHLEDFGRYARESLEDVRRLVGEDLSERLGAEGDRVIEALQKEPDRAASLRDEIMTELTRIAPRLDRIEARLAKIQDILAPLGRILDRKVGEGALSESDLAATLSREEKKTVGEVEQKILVATRAGVDPGAAPFRDLGRAWYIGRDFKRALGHFQEAAARDPKDGAAWRGVFFAALGLDKREIALDALAKLDELAEAFSPFPKDYQVDSVIGRGGMGVVFGARYRPTGKRVAIKTLSSSELVEGEEGALRLLREAKLADQLDDERVVRIREVFDSPWPMIVMEQVEGRDLGAIIREKGPFDAPKCLELVREIAKGLAVIHAAGMVHRDVKPENVILTPKGRVKITDLGLALMDGGSSLSRSGVSPGTAAYHDKDAARLARTDPRLDLYSLGQTLYYLATGWLPLGAIEIGELPEELRGVFSGLVGPPEKRPKDAAALLAILDLPVAPAARPPGPRARVAPKSGPTKYPEVKDFVFLGEERFDSGGASHGIGIYRFEPFARALALTGERRDPASEFVLVPGGEFGMGSTEWENSPPVHYVRVPPFLMARTEVVQRVWDGVGTREKKGLFGRAKMEKWLSDDRKFQGHRNPIERVSWEDIRPFLEATELRLPSEAEWEYACRAGTKTKYSFGDGDARLGEYAWYHENSGEKTHPVAEKLPNAFGLYDVHGNVSEWCEDTSQPNYYDGAPLDGSAWVKGGKANRVCRGGNWVCAAALCRSACRDWGVPAYRLSDLGFRPARSLP
ncbi:MAG: SUMF1/EgtB/PvdO family nonheme iron enzyme [Planctomycetes bacterium]|nr:SUMF1/EgtB/PvdO family nonheme iron enzyme [Planctomycetota bacterium]